VAPRGAARVPCQALVGRACAPWPVDRQAAQGGRLPWRTSSHTPFCATRRRRSESCNRRLEAAPAAHHPPSMPRPAPPHPGPFPSCRLSAEPLCQGAGGGALCLSTLSRNLELSNLVLKHNEAKLGGGGLPAWLVGCRRAGGAAGCCWARRDRPGAGPLGLVSQAQAWRQTGLFGLAAPLPPSTTTRPSHKPRRPTANHGLPTPDCQSSPTPTCNPADPD
jgi:hypothetical protein